jgi:prepilin-type N-terminal cleavage/methylation domain-containing protein
MCLAQQSRITQRHAPRAFTLVELLVVIVILTILGSLSLAGLNVGRQRAKIDATAATIRKINETVMEQYDSYSSRITASGTAGLNQLRRIMVEEMPDTWSDVFTVTSGSCKTAPGRAYARYKQLTLSNAAKLSDNASAECLYMIVTRSGFDPSALDQFRPLEVGDTDDDGLREFLDAWGNPILFIRWAPGFSILSPLQEPDSAKSHDPVDNSFADPNGYALYPLIVSRGADGLIGLNDIVAGGWSQYFTTPGLTSIIGLVTQQPISPSPGSVDPSNPIAYRDNITNHDLMAR